ncbi:MAG: DUF4297 domain-containing protein [Rhodocyclales bacterium]|nr:DUF4297 domain-containing protein [Rhodocyclales bacterium]
MNGKLLHEVEPREAAGREAIARFAAQFRAAAYMSLGILENGEIDCVFCDYHDDYVVRRRGNLVPLYDFYQVKTKGKSNYQWTQQDVFKIPRKGSPDFQEISDSFAGKLLIHTVRFGASCRSVVLQTNIQFHDQACEIGDALRDGKSDHKYASTFFKKFGEIFLEGAELDESAIRSSLSKFRLEPGSAIADPAGDNFLALAKDAVYRFSEVELSYQEFVEIAEKLLALVQRKSLRKIGEVDEASLVDAAGVTIYDLLDILAISRAGYESLVNGGDVTALRTASILHRKLKGAGVSEETIDYLCRQKVLWDEWLRAKRHIIPEFDANRLMAALHKAGKDWALSGGELEKLFEIAESFPVSGNSILRNELNRALILGGILSEVTRNQK